MDLGQRATAVKFLIRDRAGQFSGSFNAVFTAESIGILASLPQAPRSERDLREDHRDSAPGAQPQMKMVLALRGSWRFPCP